MPHLTCPHCSHLNLVEGTEPEPTLACRRCGEPIPLTDGSVSEPEPFDESPPGPFTGGPGTEPGSRRIDPARISEVAGEASRRAIAGIHRLWLFLLSGMLLPWVGLSLVGLLHSSIMTVVGSLTVLLGAVVLVAGLFAWLFPKFAFLSRRPALIAVTVVSKSASKLDPLSSEAIGGIQRAFVFRVMLTGLILIGLGVLNLQMAG